MKFVIPRSQLLDLIGSLQNVVAQRIVTIPILSNLLIEAANDELVLTATDLTVGMRCFADAKIVKEGSTTIPARRFFQLVRELPDVSVEISATGEDISHIVAGASRFKLHGMSRSEFPSLPDLSGAKQLQMSQKTLKELLFRTSFAVSHDENRYVLTGVLFRVGKGQVTLVGTDGKRLAKAWADVKLESGVSGAFILPHKAVDELSRVLSDKDTAVKIYLMKDKVAFEIDHLTLVTKLLAGDYPDVEQVIPTQSPLTVELHREELMQLLHQVLLFTSDSSHSARFTFAEGELTLAANTADIGEGKVSMPVNFSGKKLEIAFNPSYFLDILRHSRDELVRLSLTDAFNPGVITDSSESLFVLMPMRLSEQS